MLAADDLAHALLDGFQILRGERDRLALLVLAQIEIVVETRVNGWADGDLCLGVEFQHCLRHNVCSAVPQFVEIVLLDFSVLT